MPAGVVRLLFGEMGDKLLLGSQRVLPRALQDAGYQFVHNQLEGCLREILKKPEA